MAIAHMLAELTPEALRLCLGVNREATVPRLIAKSGLYRPGEGGARCCHPEAAMSEFLANGKPGTFVLAAASAARAHMGFCPECMAMLPGRGQEDLRQARAAHEQRTGHCTVAVVVLTHGQGVGHA